MRGFRVFDAFLAADFLETDFDAAMFAPQPELQVYCLGHCRQSVCKKNLTPAKRRRGSGVTSATDGSPSRRAAAFLPAFFAPL